MAPSQVTAIDIDLTSRPSTEMDVPQTVSAVGELGYPMHGGPYDATPTVDGPTLATKRGPMSKGVGIGPVPIGSVGNSSGGRTVTIG